MLIEEQLSSYLLGVDEISEVVGTNVFALRMPQLKELPAISFRIPKKEHTQDLDGTISHVDGELEIDIVGLSAKQVLDLAKIVRDSLDNQEAQLENVDNLVLISETQVFEPFPDGSERTVYHVGLEFLLQYRDS